MPQVRHCALFGQASPAPHRGAAQKRPDEPVAREPAGLVAVLQWALHVCRLLACELKKNVQIARYWERLVRTAACAGQRGLRPRAANSLFSLGAGNSRGLAGHVWPGKPCVSTPTGGHRVVYPPPTYTIYEPPMDLQESQWNLQ